MGMLVVQSEDVPFYFAFSANIKKIGSCIGTGSGHQKDGLGSIFFGNLRRKNRIVMIDFIVLVLLRYFLFGGSQGDKNVIPLNLILNARQGLQITNEGLELKVFGF